MGIFKKIIKTEIVDSTNELDEDDELLNLAVGNMLDGFDGMVAAQVYNDLNSGRTTFRVYYSDNTTKLIEVDKNTIDYAYYSKFLK